jgi:hypothetical protein
MGGVGVDVCGGGGEKCKNGKLMSKSKICCIHTINKTVFDILTSD